MSNIFLFLFISLFISLRSSQINKENTCNQEKKLDLLSFIKEKNPSISLHITLQQNSNKENDLQMDLIKNLENFLPEELPKKGILEMLTEIKNSNECIIPFIDYCYEPASNTFTVSEWAKYNNNNNIDNYKLTPMFIKSIEDNYELCKDKSEELIKVLNNDNYLILCKKANDLLNVSINDLFSADESTRNLLNTKFDDGSMDNFKKFQSEALRYLLINKYLNDNIIIFYTMISKLDKNQLNTVYDEIKSLYDDAEYKNLFKKWITIDNNFIEILFKNHCENNNNHNNFFKELMILFKIKNIELINEIAHISSLIENKQPIGEEEKKN